MLRLFSAIVLVSVCARVSGSSRIELVGQFGGERVSGVLACFSPRSVLKPRRVADRLISGPETRCLPADKVLNVPAGAWHAYLVAPDPFLVSTHPIAFERSSASSDEEGVKRMFVDLVPAATLDFANTTKLLRAGESFGVYISNAGSDISPSALVPVSPGKTHIPVPARTPLVPLVLRGTEIVRIGTRMQIDVGERGSANFAKSSNTTVIIPFIVPDANEHLSRPTVSVVHRRLGQVLLKYTPAAADYRGLMFVENVERGTLNVLVDGESVSAKPLVIVVGAAGESDVVTTEDLVMPIATTGVTIAWTIDATFGNDVRSQARCAAAKPADVSPPSLKLYACVDRKTALRPSQTQDCTLLRHSLLPALTKGEVRWLTPIGVTDAIAELTYGNISTFEPVRFDPQNTTNTSLILAPRFITGRVTYRADPVVATVACGGPVLTSDLAGYYRCWRPPGAAAAVVTTPCDGSGSYIQPFSEDATVVDVKIAANTLTVRAVHSSTGELLEDAYVSIWEGKPDQVPEPESVILGPTNQAGEVKASRVTPREVTVCAKKKEFERTCRDGIVIEPDADTSITLELRPETVVRGKVVASADIANGRIFVMLGSREIAHADVQSDGAFMLNFTPPSGAAFVFVSRSSPLCVLHRDTGTEPLTLRLPALRPVSFTVTSRTLREPLTLELGGTLISSNAFGRHQFLRRGSYVVTPGVPVSVESIDASRGITIVVGGVALSGAPIADPATLPRYPLGDRRTVELP